MEYPYTAGILVTPALGIWNLVQNHRFSKLLYLTLRNITRRWGLPLHDWKDALNHFAILFEGRIPSY